MGFSNWLLGRGRIYFWKIVSFTRYIEVTKNRKHIFMVRFILLIILILFLLWILLPFLTTNDGKKNKNTVDRILDSNQSNFRRQNTFLMIITAVILLVVFFWFLPKFGINFFALFKKIILILSYLRNILPF